MKELATTDRGAWVRASAAGAIGQAMAILSEGTPRLWKICAGYMSEAMNMYFAVHSFCLIPVRPQDADGSAVPLEEAIFGRHLLEGRAAEEGLISGPKFFGIPFLEPVP
jgi:hypothetical protein